ncbi:MAG TPA: shikimate kinase [Niallia sp.]|nr:shikimate kinase [Niallia sp.]
MTREICLEDKSIVFIGFMGVGKTTIGKAVANKLKRDFIDVDQELEKEYGMTVSEIFRKYGESSFREKEKTFIQSLSTQKQKVLSLGGGSFLQEEIRQACLENCVVIYLNMTFSCWKKRIPLLIPSRPVLQGKTEEEIEQLFNDRKPIYLEHHVEVVTDNKTSEEVAEYILSILH